MKEGAAGKVAAQAGVGSSHLSLSRTWWVVGGWWRVANLCASLTRAWKGRQLRGGAGGKEGEREREWVAGEWVDGMRGPSSSPTCERAYVPPTLPASLSQGSRDSPFLPGCPLLLACHPSGSSSRI